MASIPHRYAAAAACFVCCCCLAAFAIGTLHWTLISDAVLMHYVGLLTQHGMAPYRDIADINMPGTYLLDMAWDSLFGTGALAWRFFDFSLIAIAGIAMIVLARPYSLLGGFLAASLFALLHGADGVAHAGERDFVVAVLLLTGCAFLLSALRRSGSPGRILLLGWGCSVGFAASIKPQAVVAGLSVTLLAAIATRRRGQPIARLLVYSCLGAAVPCAACVAFLLREHALGSFLTTTRSLVLLHTSLGRHSLPFLLAHAIPAQLLPIMLVAAGGAWKHSRWPTLEGAVLLLCAAFGLLSFVVQGKAYPYHRATLVAFLLCWALVELVRRVQCWKRRIPRGGGGGRVIMVDFGCNGRLRGAVADARFNHARPALGHPRAYAGAASS